MSNVVGLKCVSCEREFQPGEIDYTCPSCDPISGTLEVVYDYQALGRCLTRERIERGPPSIWRYADLLPCPAETAVDIGTGYTPLIRAAHLGRVLGLERLSDEAKKEVQTSELSKEVQIQASRETEPEKQIEILKMASDGNKTVRDIRNQTKQVGVQNSDNNETFSQWSWRSKKGRFTVSVRFMEKHPLENKTKMVRAALKDAVSQISGKRKGTRR